MLKQQLQETIRNVPDFPKPGIQFKDITPVLANPVLSNQVSLSFYHFWRDQGIEGVVGIESRGFIFGMQLAQQLQVPFIPVRKAGKLPYKTLRHSYELEYGTAEVEMHEDALSSGQKILIHDDLLATGGTALAASQLIQKAGGIVSGFSFLVELGFLGARKELELVHPTVHSLITY